MVPFLYSLESKSSGTNLLLNEGTHAYFDDMKNLLDCNRLNVHGEKTMQ
jgi:hypothetical protein